MTSNSKTVEFLQKKGYNEIFTELFDTKSKINLFYNCDSIVGPIGGGLCNAVFSKNKTKLYPIILFISILSSKLYFIKFKKLLGWYNLYDIFNNSYKFEV